MDFYRKCYFNTHNISNLKYMYITIISMLDLFLRMQFVTNILYNCFIDEQIAITIRHTFVVICNFVLLLLFCKIKL